METNTRYTPVYQEEYAPLYDSIYEQQITVEEESETEQDIIATDLEIEESPPFIHLPAPLYDLDNSTNPPV